MAKKTEKLEYADDLHNPQEYVLAWLIGGGHLNESVEFEQWIRNKVEFNGKKLSRNYIREILREYYRYENIGTSDLALMVLDYRYCKLKSGIVTDMALHELSKAFDEKETTEYGQN